MRPEPQSRWIAGRCRAGTPRVRLICIPQSGGGAGAFSSWRAHLPDGVELAPVELPERGTRARERMPVGMGALADALYEGLRPELDMPYLLFGHSFGGMLAYEVAVRAERDHVRAPLAALISGTRAPQVPPRRRLAHSDERTLLTWLSDNGGLPAELLDYPAFLTEVTRAVRMDLGYAESYLVPQPTRIDTPLYAFGGADDLVTPPDALPHWERCAAGEFTVTTLPGDHGYPYADPGAMMAAIGRLLPTGPAAVRPGREPAHS